MACGMNSHRRRGFTLVELLVVIAIIGILVALLLPAVQAARESARRTQCTNHLKQLVLAAHNHHDSLKRFPPGGAMDQPPFGTDLATGSGSRWGSSWMVYLLPYYEQQNLFEKWEFKGQSGAFNNNNNAAAKGLIIKTLLCPSSPLIVAPAPRRTESFMSSYVCVSGAVDGLISGYSETRVATLPCGGQISGGGPLIPNGQITFADINDGTAHTLALSEQSNFLKDNTGKKQEWRASQTWGWYLGVKATGIPPNFDNIGSDNRQPNMTTIRYPINYTPPGGWANNVAGLGVGLTGNCVGANVPLNSAHANGVNAAFCDGSVRFMPSNIPLGILAQVATRDDGVAVPDF